MKPFPACLLLAMLIVCPGCTPMKEGEVSEVKLEMGLQQVRNRIGPPSYVEYGEDMHLGMEVWHYPKGSVYFYRLSVIRVIEASEEQQTRLIQQLRKKEKPELPNFSKF